MIKRVILDVNYTLLIPNYNKQHQFLSNYVPQRKEYFIYNMYEILKQYDKEYKFYDKIKL